MPNRILLQALIYSLLIHAVLVLCFRIRLFDFRSEPVAFTPAKLFVDDEPVASASIIQEKLKTAPTVFLDELTEHTEESRSQIQALFVQDIAFPDQGYPLRIKCSPSLKPLLLIEDGSHLFKHMTSPHQQEVSLLSCRKFTIEYSVDVDGTTGKLSSWSRTRELLDKELQQIADKIVSELRFAPHKKSLSGKLWINFYCSGEELQDYLDTGLFG
jgi:hypothetical protein